MDAPFLGQRVVSPMSLATYTVKASRGDSRVTYAPTSANQLMRGGRAQTTPQDFRVSCALSTLGKVRT
jgi:hypothetical protein